MGKQFLDYTGLQTYDENIKTFIDDQNLQSDWTQSDNTKKDFIKNKPTLGTASEKDVPTTGDASATQVVMGNDSRFTELAELKALVLSYGLSVSNGQLCQTYTE